jgi:hypothetical protein
VQTPLEERNILCKAAMLMGFIGFQFEVKVTKGGSCPPRLRLKKLTH